VAGQQKNVAKKFQNPNPLGYFNPGFCLPSLLGHQLSILPLIIGNMRHSQITKLPTEKLTLPNPTYQIA